MLERLVGIEEVVSVPTGACTGEEAVKTTSSKPTSDMDALSNAFVSLSVSKAAISEPGDISEIVAADSDPVPSSNKLIK